MAGGPTPGSPADVQPDADPEQVARTIVLRKLSAAPRTRAELAGELAKRGVDSEVATHVLDRFVEVGLVDDADFAQMWVESRQRTRGTARPVLRRELRDKGVAEEYIDAALADLDGESESEAARMLVARKWKSVARLDEQVRTRRLMSMLQRRGHGMSIALTAIREVSESACEADQG